MKYTTASSNVVESYDIILSPSELLIWSFTVSIFTIGGMIGSLLVGFLVQRYGRKKSQLLMNSLSISAAIMEGCSKAANSIVLLIIPRFFLGVYAGLATGIVPMYIGEISPKKYRGAIGVLNQLLITVGLLMGQIFGLTELLGTEELWPLLLALTCVPSILELCVLPFCPESPRCLLIDRNQEDKAREALIRLRKTQDVDDEIEEMKKEAAAESSASQMSLLELIRDKSVRWQVISVFAVHIGQPTSGINAIFFYLNLIFETAGVEEGMRNYFSICVGTVNVIMTVIAAGIIEKTGRKSLLLSGYAILTVSCLLMTIALSLQETVPAMSYASIVCVIIFIIGFAIGPGPIPWILTAEMFRQSARPAAFTLGCCLNWTFNIIVALIFPFMQKFMGQYVFVVFLISGAISTAYTFFVIPETKNKSFQEISLIFAKRNGIKEFDIEKDEIEMEELNKA
ncbi:solute carrier family 2, facilitated glucose transporter member 5-like isoform X2 [Styela clava]